ncbi:MAG: glycosyltransferase [Steroidobacteraceae bacterium]
MGEPLDNPIKVMHLLSATHQYVNSASANTLSAQLTPLLGRIDPQHVQMQVVNFAPGDRQAALMRQLSVPVHDIELSRRRFAPNALGELRQRVGKFKPDVIHAWGHTAQLATRLLPGAGRTVPMVWSMPAKIPNPNFDQESWLDRYKLNLLSKQAKRPAHLVYGSASGAAHYSRMGFPENTGCVINNGVDVDRFKPDAKQGQQLRAQLKLEASSVVIGMHAAFMPENDYATFIRACADLIKYQPNIHVIVAGRGVQRGNAGLMAMLGGGTLATHTSLLGEWSDLNAFFNACDVVCSSALDDGGATMLASAMLCGVPCVGTGKGMQGEVLFKQGITIESGSPAALSRGITRVLEMPADKRAYLIDSARKHIITNHSTQGAVQKYLGLYLNMMHKVEVATAAQAMKLTRAANG